METQLSPGLYGATYKLLKDLSRDEGMPAVIELLDQLSDFEVRMLLAHQIHAATA